MTRLRDRAQERFHPPHEIGILFTRLGENLTDLTDAQSVADHYHDLLDKIRARGLDAEISVKPTQLGLDLDPAVTLGHLLSLAAHAGEAGGDLWLDMEGSAYTDATLDLYRQVKATHPNVAICLQAYLRRTPADVHALLPLKPGIRLVKGAYDEPSGIASAGRTWSGRPTTWTSAAPSKRHVARTGADRLALK